MTRDGIRALQAIVAIAVVGALGYLLFNRFFAWNAGPETDIIVALKRAESGWTHEASSPLALAADRVRYERIAVQLLGPDEAFAGATIDFDGRLGERTKVSALGVERVLFARRQGSWQPVHGLAPRLLAVVEALDRRRRALNEGDLEELGQLARGAGAVDAVRPVLALRKRSYTASAWYIRLERDEAVVTEDYRLTGETPDRPVDEKGSRRLRLSREGDEFFFSPGLM